MCSRALKRYLASDPRLRALFPRDPMACFFTKIFSTHCFRRTSGCASIGAILNHLSAGHGQNPIGTGGSSFCETPGGLAFGTNSILSGVVLKRCMPASNDRRAFSVLLIQYLQKAASSRLASDYTVAE